MHRLINDIEKAIGSGKKHVLVSSLDENCKCKVLVGEAGAISAVGDMKLTEEECSLLYSQELTGNVELEGRSVLCEILYAEPRLVICGAGHVAEACVRIAKVLGLRTTVIEDRPDFIENIKAAGADETICGPLQESVRAYESTKDTYFLSMNRAHALDQDCMEVILNKESAYVGMLGGPKKINALKANLEKKGIPASKWDGVHSPVGLSINAKTPAEIAVSILGEIIEIKNANPVENTFTEDLFKAVGEAEKPAMLVTLIDNGGGSPRTKGTKMVVFAEDSRVGTIGGGLLEGTAQRRAAKLLEEGADWVLETIGLDDDGKVENGLACCGYATVLMERI